MICRLPIGVLGVCIAALAWGDPAVVDTPGDGFLALRSEPSTARGVRLAKIPHGTRLELGECVGPSATQRWCRTDYRGQAGWILATYVVADTLAVPDASSGRVDPAVERAILRAMSGACLPHACRARVEQVLGGYATVGMECTKPACENATAYLEKIDDRWVLVDYGTGLSAEDLLGYGFPSSVVEAFMPGGD